MIPDHFGLWLLMIVKCDVLIFKSSINSTDGLIVF